MSEESSSSSSSDSDSGDDAQAPPTATTTHQNSTEDSPRAQAGPVEGHGSSSAASSPAPDHQPTHETSPDPVGAASGGEMESASPGEEAIQENGAQSEPPPPESEQTDDTSKFADDLYQKESSSDDSDIERGQKTAPRPSKERKEGENSSDSDGPQQQALEEGTQAVAGDSPAFEAAQEDLFGDAGDLSSSDDEKKPEKPEEEFGEEDIVGPRMYIEEEEDQSRQPPTETVINVEAPRINADLGNQIHFVKFPNFLSVEPRHVLDHVCQETLRSVFDAETYEDEIDEDEVLDEEGRSRLKLKVENTIRWRNCLDDEGNSSKESNAKIVRWSDGTMSLYLGSEIFDVHMQPTVGDHNHLFVRQGQGLQGQAVFRTKLTFRPHSTDTLTHRKMTLSMADRSSKAQKVKVLAEVGNDPETQKQELVRKEEERLRASARRESQQRRIRERNLSRGLSAGFLEPDRDEDSDEGESLAAIKRSYKPGGKDFDKTVRGLDKGGGSESDDSAEGRKKLRGAKRLDSEEEEEEEEDDEEEKEDSPAEEKSSKRRKVIADSDEDDDD